MIVLVAVAVLLSTSSATFPNIPSLYVENKAVPSWNSDHWNSGARSLTPRDRKDVTGLSQRRGKYPVVSVTDGVMTMSGEQPRLYLNPWIKPEADGRHWTLDEEAERLASDRPTTFYKNTEVTVYYKRHGIYPDDAAYAGLVIGCRSSPNGHTKELKFHEDAHTYYAKFRHDGKAQFLKEVTHPDFAAHSIRHLFSGGPLPEGRWLGMKFVVYNLDDRRVKLELYIDTVSDGKPGRVLDPKNWEKVGEMIDDGTNFVTKTSGGVDGKSAIIEGGGVVFIRNTRIKKAEYKYLQVKEILTPAK